MPAVRLFSIALSLRADSVFAVMPAVLQEGRSVLCVSGVLSAIGLIGIGLTPCDRYFVAHHAALGLWIGPMVLMIAAFSAYAKLTGISSAMLSIVTILVTLAVCAYAFAGSHNGHVVFQKILAILAACWFSLVFITVSMSTVQSISSRRLMVERQATQYLKALQRSQGRRYRPND